MRKLLVLLMLLSVTGLVSSEAVVAYEESEFLFEPQLREEYSAALDLWTFDVGTTGYFEGSYVATSSYSADYLTVVSGQYEEVLGSIGLGVVLSGPETLEVTAGNSVSYTHLTLPTTPYV